MADDELFARISAQRIAFTDELGALTAEQWATPSLCSEWTVKDVLGHLIATLRPGAVRNLLWDIVKAGFNPNKGVDRAARAVAAGASPAELVAELRRRADQKFTPPGSGPIAPLTDVTIHRRDVGRVVGWTDSTDPADAKLVLDFLCGGRARGFVPSKRTAGLSFAATDIDWSSGTGPEVAGTSEAITLAVSGRRVALADLDGSGIAELTRRLS